MAVAGERYIPSPIARARLPKQPVRGRKEEHMHPGPVIGGPNPDWASNQDPKETTRWTMQPSVGMLVLFTVLLVAAIVAIVLV